jgi:hypothetical protein
MDRIPLTEQGKPNRVAIVELAGARPASALLPPAL